MIIKQTALKHGMNQHINRDTLLLIAACDIEAYEIVKDLPSSTRHYLNTEVSGRVADGRPETLACHYEIKLPSPAPVITLIITSTAYTLKGNFHNKTISRANESGCEELKDTINQLLKKP